MEKYGESLTQLNDQHIGWYGHTLYLKIGVKE